jgi:hypothetical protein
MRDGMNDHGKSLEQVLDLHRTSSTPDMTMQEM